MGEGGDWGLGQHWNIPSHDSGFSNDFSDMTSKATKRKNRKTGLCEKF
jgi:hypothetical protein